MTGADEANEACAAADVVLAVGTRLNDFVTGSWTLFDPTARIIGLNTARFDATKHRCLPVVGDARESLVELSDLLGSWAAPQEWTASAVGLRERLGAGWPTGSPTTARSRSATPRSSAPCTGRRPRRTT